MVKICFLRKAYYSPLRNSEELLKKNNMYFCPPPTINSKHTWPLLSKPHESALNLATEMEKSTILNVKVVGRGRLQSECQLIVPFIFLCPAGRGGDVYANPHFKETLPHCFMQSKIIVCERSWN